MLFRSVRNRENKLLAYRQLFIQRMNPKEKQVVQDEYRMMDINNSFVSLMNDADSLKEFIACLAPISTQLELQTEDNLMALGELQSMKQFLLYFWIRKNADQPEAAWLTYKAEVAKVQKAYGTLNKRGYETDRGRVYLQYGPPNSVSGEIGRAHV